MFGLALMVLCNYTISLVWIEICQASKRLSLVSKNLLRARLGALAYMTFFLLASLACTFSTVFYSEVFYYFFALQLVSCVIAMLIYQYAAWRMRALVANFRKLLGDSRPSEQRSSEAGQPDAVERMTKALPQLEGGGATSGPQQRSRGTSCAVHTLILRLQNITSTANRVSAGLGCAAVSTSVVIAAVEHAELELGWVASVLGHVAVSYSTAECCCFTVRRQADRCRDAQAKQMASLPNRYSPEQSDVSDDDAVDVDEAGRTDMSAESANTEPDAAPEQLTLSVHST